ncbi:hypothetical protein [Coralloluteibacterium thermophilus]|uniref:CBM-cenC domain-containing protein n=1 Tax=Coralloluteibacterium thermophilum TaxID=2707049 RepID=A0ABV9NJD4_9GAMM
MAAPTWSPGTLYRPGALVQPRTSTGVVQTALQNPDFEQGNVGWDLGPGFSIFSGTSVEGRPYQGNWGLLFVQPAQDSQVREATNLAKVPVRAGQSISASAMVNLGGPSQQFSFWLQLVYLDANDEPVGQPIQGNRVTRPAADWRRISVTGVAPAGAVWAVLQTATQATNYNPTPRARLDSFTWNYAFAGAPDGLLYKAVQAEAGRSGSTEPAWPPVLGVQVVDNEVIWEAVLTNRVVWEARPVLKTGETEPAWPEVPGAFVLDGTISWRTTARNIEDDNCPNTSVVLIAAAKVFGAYRDVTRFSATANPRDWSAVEDAGFLDTGQQSPVSSETKVLAFYRGNMALWTPSTMQLWQVDPDPSQMSLLDTIEGIGSIWPKATAPVAGDVYFLSTLGVRSVSIAGGSTNLQSGDIGMPVDVLVQAELLALQEGEEPLAFYYPSAGQYWLAFPRVVLVFTQSQIGGVGAWSAYDLPWPVEAHAQREGELYLRSGDVIYQVDENALDDDGVDFDGVIQWPWLDFGPAGMTKMLHAFDLIGTGMAEVQFGFDQTNGGLFTAPYEVPADTVPGCPIPMPLSAPSMSVRIIFRGPQEWELQSVILYLDDLRGNP